MMESVISMPMAKMGVNYGLNKVSFPAPVPVGGKVRARAQLQEVEDIPGGAQLVWKITIERQGGDKPVCVAESIAQRYC